MLLKILFLLPCVLCVPLKNKEWVKIKRSIDLITALERNDDARLPRDVTPSGYKLELHPFLEEKEFHGHVTINISCQEDTDKITLHAHQELDISENDVTVMFITHQVAQKGTTTTTTSTEAPVLHAPPGAARLLPVSSSFLPESGACTTIACAGSGVSNYLTTNKSGRAASIEEDSNQSNTEDTTEKEEVESEEVTEVLVPMRVSRTERQPGKQRYVIHLSDSLKRGEQYQLGMKFVGPLQTEVKEGLFLDSYVDKEVGQQRFFVATQLRPHNARRVFPCFDEPSFKVPFEISIARTTNLVSLSNMPIRQTETIPDDPDRLWDHFEPTPPISTFSLQIIVSDFEFVRPESFNPNTIDDTPCKKVRVHGRKDLISSLQLAANIAPRVIKAVQDYLGSPLPVPKLDIVAAPGYLDVPDSGWGVIVFKESELIATTEDILSQVLAREIVYQWIGNLVTPHWWSDAHINKALAGFISSIITTKINPNAAPLWFKYYPLYYEYGRSEPFKQIPSQKPDISVTKSQLVLRMLNYSLSGDTFRKGIQHFISERKYKTFTQEDVWTALTEQADLDETLPELATCNQIAESWIKKDRLPVVQITRDYVEKLAVVKQSIFIRYGPEAEHDNSSLQDLTWWIPIITVTKDQLDFINLRRRTWMKEEKQIIINNLPASDQFIIVNPEEIGPYIVNYDVTNWYLLSQYLEEVAENPTIPPATRAKLVHDALNLAYSGLLTFDVALNMTRFLACEKDPNVWQPVLNLLDHIQRQISEPDTLSRWQEYIQKLVSPLYEELQERSNLTSTEERIKRAAKSALCNVGYQPCISESQDEWKKWMISDDPEAGVPVRQEYFCWVFMWGTADEWEFGLDRYLKYPPDRQQTDRYYLLKTLASCPKDPNLVERLLNVTLLSADTNLYESSYVLNSLTNEAGYKALFNLLNNNWDTLKTKYEVNDNRLWENIISSATRNFKTRDELEMVSELFVERQGEFGSGELVVEQSIKEIKRSVKWSEDNISDIDQWLMEYLIDE